MIFREISRGLFQCPPLLVDLFDLNPPSFNISLLMIFQEADQIIAFLGVAECFAEVAGQLDAVMPLAGLRDAAPGEFHDDVHRLAAGHVAGQESADSI